MAELQADGVFEEAEGNIRQQLMAAAQLARSAVQARQDAAQRATRRDLEEARQLQVQLDAQRVAARAELAPVHNASWWDQAQVRDVARAYETAVTFRDEDQAARDAESRIRQELRERYDVEVLETGADPAVVRATLFQYIGTPAASAVRFAVLTYTNDVMLPLMSWTKIFDPGLFTGLASAAAESKSPKTFGPKNCRVKTRLINWFAIAFLPPLARCA